MSRNMPSLSRCFCVLVTIVWLAGCATRQPVDISGTPDLALQKRLAAVDRWQFAGKLAVRTTGQSESAHIIWQQDGKGFDIRLSGPAGLKATHIYGMPGDANVEQGDRHASAESVEALSEQLVGWPLPADELTWWLRGMPASSQPVQSVGYTPEGWMAYLVQDGWTIQLGDHQHISGLVMPGRIEAVRGDIKIILVIKEWQVR
jgi:outer membrane lipoprotein LolB